MAIEISRRELYALVFAHAVIMAGNHDPMNADEEEDKDFATLMFNAADVMIRKA